MRGQLSCAAEEVGMQVGVGGPRDPKPATFRCCPDRTQVTADVHDECTTISQVHEVGGVAQPLVQDRMNRQLTHPHSAPSLVGARLLRSLHRQPSRCPLRKPVLEARGGMPALVQQPDSVVGVDAVRATAVGDDVRAAGDLAQS